VFGGYESARGLVRWRTFQKKGEAGMNAAMIDRIVSLIPERVARQPSGAAFTLEASACRYPERIAHLARFLNWMSPLNPITRDDQRIFGLLNEQGRPVHAVDMEDDEAADIEDAGVAGEVRQAEEMTA
jgi:hypothetical protein